MVTWGREGGMTLGSACIISGCYGCRTQNKQTNKQVLTVARHSEYDLDEERSNQRSSDEVSRIMKRLCLFRVMPSVRDYPNIEADRLAVF